MIHFATAARSWLAIALFACYSVCVILPLLAPAFTGKDHLAEGMHDHNRDMHKNPKQHSHLGAADIGDEYQQASVSVSFIIPVVATAVRPAWVARAQSLTSVPPDKLNRPPKAWSNRS
jgi:hypothetical protein